MKLLSCPFETAYGNHASFLPQNEIQNDGNTSQIFHDLKQRSSLKYNPPHESEASKKPDPLLLIR